MRRVAALLLLAGLAVADPAAAAVPGDNGGISFSSQGDLWSVAPDGSGLRQLTATPDDEAQSAFSPDGTQLAYRRRPTANDPYQVYVMAADGSGQHRVSASTVNDTQPAWSPDGRELIFRRSTPGQSDGDVWAMNADGSAPHALVVSAGADERYPMPSPDGTRLAFTSNRVDNQYDVYVAAADGANPARLTSDPGYDSAPSWAPDAARLAFERGTALDADSSKEIWIMGADGGGQTQLTFTAGVVDEGPAFSPDGTQIAFTSGRQGNYDVFRMDADGSNQQPVLSLATKEESPDWQAIARAATVGPVSPPAPSAPAGPSSPPAAPSGAVTASAPSGAVTAASPARGGTPARLVRGPLGTTLRAPDTQTRCTARGMAIPVAARWSARALRRPVRSIRVLLQRPGSEAVIDSVVFAPARPATTRRATLRLRACRVNLDVRYELFVGRVHRPHDHTSVVFRTHGRT